MKQRKLFIRIVCIFLAILMLGGVLVAAIQAFASEPQVTDSVVAEYSCKLNPETGCKCDCACPKSHQ